MPCSGSARSTSSPKSSKKKRNRGAPGEVIRQSPSAGKKVDAGSTVTIVVAKAVKLTVVPNVVGKERRKAVERVREKGLVPVVEQEETEFEEDIGRVIEQEPEAKEEVEPGSKVTLIVGKRALVEEGEGE